MKKVLFLFTLLLFLLPEIYAQSVYNTKTGAKYHSGGCSSLKRSSIPIVTSQIISQTLNYKKDFPLSYNDYLFPNFEFKVIPELIRIDSILTYSIEGSGLKLLFQYNNNLKMTEWLILWNDGSGWLNEFKNELFYDEQNYLTTQVSLDWHTNRWDSSSRNNYRYESGMLSQSVFQIYENNSWTNLTRDNYKYDSNNNLLNNLIESWVNNNWQKYLLTTYYYSTGNRLDSLLFQLWVNNEWHNDKKTIYYYKVNGIDPDSAVTKSWDNFTWTNFYKREITSDINHNQIEQIDMIWDNSSWLNSIRRFFSYNEAHFIESARCEIWYNNQWTVGDGDIVFRNPDGFIVGFITNNISAYYSNIVGVSDDYNSKICNYSLFQNYPNPFNPNTNIKYQIPDFTLVNLEVFDVLGKEVATLVNEEKPAGSYEISWYAGNLPSGIYFYKLMTGSFVQIKKMVLLK